MSTLRSQDCMLRAMFSGQMPVRRDSDGFVIIDRSGKHFDKILNYLRDGVIPLPSCRHEVAELLVEAQYYLIESLADYCSYWLKHLVNKYNNPTDVPQVPIVMNDDGVERILKTCPDRPLIELLMNRQNNKYSYTQQSDENFLKNQEIFDKLVLRINSRVIFVKNIGTSSSEMCRWRFHCRNGKKKKTEICCTSILYATDRKQTKVDFPEARIYEETMNILLSNDSVESDCSTDDPEPPCNKCMRANMSMAAFGNDTISHAYLPRHPISKAVLDESPLSTQNIHLHEHDTSASAPSTSATPSLSYASSPSANTIYSMPSVDATASNTRMEAASFSGISPTAPYASPSSD